MLVWILPCNGVARTVSTSGTPESLKERGYIVLPTPGKELLSLLRKSPSGIYTDLKYYLRLGEDGEYTWGDTKSLSPWAGSQSRSYPATVLIPEGSVWLNEYRLTEPYNPGE